MAFENRLGSPATKRIFFTTGNYEKREAQEYVEAKANLMLAVAEEMGLDMDRVVNCVEYVDLEVNCDIGALIPYLRSLRTEYGLTDYDVLVAGAMEEDVEEVEYIREYIARDVEGWIREKITTEC